MYKLLKSTKDATIYQNNPNTNTGLDSILEIGSTHYEGGVSRILIHFNLEDINNIEEATLLLSETESTEIPLDYSIEGYLVSGSWDMGIGKKLEQNDITGVNWSEKSENVQWAESGSDYYSSISGSHTFEYSTADLALDILPLVGEVISGSIINDGFLIKFDEFGETSTNGTGVLKFFSKESHTIHQPKLRIGWDDQTHVTGSLLPVDIDESRIVILFDDSYKVDNIYTIRINARDQFPIKDFDEYFRFSVNKYLPTSTFFSVQDFITKDTIIPFSDYSKVSCDEKGNYIILDFNDWESGRVYELVIKTIINNDTKYYKNKFTFKVVK